MQHRSRLSASSRDSHLTLRRVDRQQALIERLSTHQSGRVPLAALAAGFGVSERTVARDVERLRDSGVPLDVRPGRGGGVRMVRVGRIEPIAFDLAEVAVLLTSLAVLGPTSSPSAGSALRKLSEALSPNGTED